MMPSAEKIGSVLQWLSYFVAVALFDALGARQFANDKEGLARLTPNDDWYPPAIFFQGMKFMLFGDPTLPLSPPEMGKD